MSVSSGRRSIANAAFIFAVLLCFCWNLSFNLSPAGAATSQDPAPPPPDFSLIQDWEGRARLDTTTGFDLNAVATAVARLCRYYGASFDRKSPLMSNPSPLEWPRVFKSETVNPRRLRTDIELLMQGNGLAFRPMVTLEDEGTADSIARAISEGAPVLMNVPEAVIIYGYDFREPDAWWWVQRLHSTEIMFETERVATLMYWADDPASNLAWAVTGADSALTVQKPNDRTAGYAWLQRLIESVRNDPSRGIKAYPLSLRAFRDQAGGTAQVPELAEPVRTSDPLGVRRARNARSQLIGLLEWLSNTTTDTLESEPLRLALYFYHNAMQSLEQLDTLLYDAQPGAVSAERYEANWRNDVRKIEIVRRFDDLLEWEKQAAEAVGEAVSAVTKPKKK